MIHVSNHRHVPDVVLFVHDPPQLVRSKLHLQTSELTKTANGSALIQKLWAANRYRLGNENRAEKRI